MGYHITVRRAEGAPPISQAEFERACGLITDLKFDPVDGKAEFYRAGELAATLMHQDGEIWTKVPEPEVISKMVSLASHLEAKAYGDEGEWYSEDGTAHYPPGALEKQTERIRRTKRKELVINIVKITLITAILTMVIINKLKK